MYPVKRVRRVCSIGLCEHERMEITSVSESPGEPGEVICFEEGVLGMLLLWKGEQRV